MNRIISKGLICLKNELNIEFAICKIEYILNEDETFKYVFTPYYDVIDLIDSSLFQGIPGLEIDLRKKEYIRENIAPTFISERVPSINREDYFELLESVGLNFMDPIQYLIRTKAKYSGDNLYVIEYKDRESISLESNVGKSNSIGIIKIILNNIAIGNSLTINGEDVLDAKGLFRTLLFIYKKVYKTNCEKQKLGAEQAKEQKKIYWQKADICR